MSDYLANLINRAEAALKAAEEQHGAMSLEVAERLDVCARILRESGTRQIDAANMEARAQVIRDRVAAPAMSRQPHSDFTTSSEHPRGEASSKNCPFCSEVIKATAIKCRYCLSDLDGDSAPGASKLTEAGSSRTKPQSFLAYLFKGAVATAFVLFCIAVVYNYVSGRGESTRATTVAVPQAPQLSLSQIKPEGETYGGSLIGFVHNNSDKTYSYVQIQANGYSSSGSLIDNAMDACNNLEPHGSWRFKLTFHQRVRKYKITSVTGL